MTDHAFSVMHYFFLYVGIGIVPLAASISTITDDDKKKGTDSFANIPANVAFAACSAYIVTVLFISYFVAEWKVG